MKKAIFLSIMLMIALSYTNAQQINSITPQQPLPKYLIFVKFPDGTPVTNSYVEIIDYTDNVKIGEGRTNQNGFFGFEMDNFDPTHQYLIRVQPCGQKLESYPSEGPRYVYITSGYDPC